MKSLKQLLDSRAEMLAKARTILDTVKRENREFHDDERQLLDKAENEVERLTREIDRIEEDQKSFSLKGTPLDALNASRHMLAPSDRLVQAVHSTFDESSPAKALRGIITGRWNDAQREQLAVAGSGTGGFTMSPELSAWFIDKARANSVCIAAGAKTFTMQTAEMRVPRLTSDATAYWRTELQAITESDPGFGALQLSAKTVACLVPCSVELLEDSPHAAEMITNSIAKTIGLAIDRALLEGSGAASEPMGLWTEPNVQSYAVSALISPDHLSHAVRLCRAANHEPNAVIWSARTAGQYDKLKTGDGAYFSSTGVGPASVNALPKFVSTQISETDGGGTDSHAYVGNFAEMAIALRTTMNLEMFREGYSTSGSAVQKLMVYVRAYARMDSYIARPDAFVKLTGLSAS